MRILRIFQDTFIRLLGLPLDVLNLIRELTVVSFKSQEEELRRLMSLQESAMKLLAEYDGEKQRRDALKELEEVLARLVGKGIAVEIKKGDNGVTYVFCVRPSMLEAANEAAKEATTRIKVEATGD